MSQNINRVNDKFFLKKKNAYVLLITLLTYWWRHEWVTFSKHVYQMEHSPEATTCPKDSNKELGLKSLKY